MSAAWLTELITGPVGLKGLHAMPGFLQDAADTIASFVILVAVVVALVAVGVGIGIGYWIWG